MAINIQEKVTFDEYVNIYNIPKDLQKAFKVYANAKISSIEMKIAEWDFLYNAMLSRKTNYK